MTGLCDRIKAAPSKDAVEVLLTEGKTFKLASAVTRRRWERLATKRIQFLTAPKASPKKEGK